MSDYEDDMDIDGAPRTDSIQFSSENTAIKGKRIVADLPIEAEDNLPWRVVKWPILEIALTRPQGREVPSTYPRRCIWPSRHPSDHQQIH
jgi:hypothetical protein